ncbi:MAG: hypothetical protein WC789_10415 [Lentisphaeria bacterium]
MGWNDEENGNGMADFFKAVHAAGVEAGKATAAEATRVTTHEIAGRAYVKEGAGAMREVKPPRVILRLPTFGAVADFADAVKSHAKEPCVVMVGTQGAVAYLTPECKEDEQDTIGFRVFRAALPPETALSYPGFMELLDLYSGAVTEEKDLRTALKVLKAVKTSATKFEDRGAYTHVTFEGGANVDAAGMDIPKIVHFNVAYGDPTYDMSLCYRLTIAPDGDGLVFRLAAMPHVDQRDEKFVGRALVDLRERLGLTGHEVFRSAS